MISGWRLSVCGDGQKKKSPMIRTIEEERGRKKEEEEGIHANRGEDDDRDKGGTEEQG